MLYLEFSKLLEEGVQFHKCGRCGRYFLSKGDYHEQYCDRILPGEGRTCQQLTAQEVYQNKLKENDGQNALNIYQKYYKRYFARICCKGRCGMAVPIYRETIKQRCQPQLLAGLSIS